MKKIITLFTFCFCAGMVVAQTPALKVAADGNVGIGIDVPLSKLHIAGGGMSFSPPGQVFNMKSQLEGTRFQFQSFTNTQESWSYFTLFGDESLAGNQNRRGEVGFFGQYHIFRTGVTDVAGGSQFGSEAMRLTTDGLLAVGQTSVPAGHVAAFAGDIQVNGVTIASDRKLKANIRSFDYGLDEVLRMSPKFYNYNGEIIRNDGLKAGIIAQEFEKIIPEAVKEVEYENRNLENEVVESGSYLAVNTDMIKFALVNAIQDQQTMIDELRAENDELRDMINKIAASLDNTDNQIDATIAGKTASLDQNTPNPFKGQTELRYVVPTDAQNAKMVITSNAGQVIKTITIAHTGKGVISLTGNDIPAGNYHYTLVVDGNQIDTKTMTLVN